MRFTRRELWECEFLEADLATVLPRRLSLSDPAVILEMAERGGCKMNLEGRQAVQHAIDSGHGGVWLQLTSKQYSKLLGKSWKIIKLDG